MRPPPLHRFLEQPAFNHHHHHYATGRASYGGSNGTGVGSGSGGGGLGAGGSSGGGGGGGNGGNGKSSVNYSGSGTGLHAHHHHHHHHQQQQAGGTGQGGSGTVGGGNGGTGAGNMTINTSAESSSDYKPNLALSDYTNTADWTNGLGAPSSTSYMSTFSPLQASPPSYVAYESCPMVDHPNYSLAASGVLVDNTQPYQDYYALSGPPPPPGAAVAPSAVNSQAQLGGQIASGGTGAYVGKSGDLVEASSYSYPHHAQWTNGYHGGYHHHQYPHPTVATGPGCAPSMAVATQPPASFHTPAVPPPPPPPPPMVLCPQMFSTVNQNQIHVHLHGSGSEKFEHYFGSSDNGFTINSFPGPGIRSVAAPVASSLSGSSVDLGIGSHQDGGVVGGAGDSLTALLSAHHEDTAATHQHQPQHASGQEQQQDEGRSEESVAGDPSSVWRPY
uniref:Uncharacterized protein n=2 Tax=Anopheles atroparvus TaxID=41427 RepID=A0A182JC16_ANOAO